MDSLNLHFLNILQSALRRESAQLPELSAADWVSLAELAQSHHVLPMFFEAIHGLPQLQDTHILAQTRQRVRQQIYVQTQKTADFLQLNQRFHENGIQPLVVKGIVCRDLYPYPDHRASADEDILIREDQFTRCHQILTEFGLETTVADEDRESQYELPYRSGSSRLFIELHRSLFPPESDAYGHWNSYFDHVWDRMQVQEFQGCSVYTMHPTDHMLYLICHAMKHFLHSGFGIRQVCDITLFANTYGEQIDWQEVLERCSQIHADRFAAAIFRIGEKYLTFDPHKACYPAYWHEIAVDETAMLEDLLNGGVYGNADQNRIHSSNITLDAVASQRKGKSSDNPLAAALFPSAKTLSGVYPYLKKRPYLLPVAWVSRIGRYCAESAFSKQTRGVESLRIGNRRVELLKQYGILK